MPDPSQGECLARPEAVALLALCGDPPRITLRRLWAALPRAARHDAIVGVLGCQCGWDHAGLAALIAEVLKVRPQTVLQRDPDQIASFLESRDLPQALSRSLLLHYVAVDQGRALERFLEAAAAVVGSWRVVAICNGVEIDLDRVRSAADHVLAREDLITAAAVLQTLYAMEGPLKVELGGWLMEIAVDPIPERVRALRRTDEPELTKTDEDVIDALSDLSAARLPERVEHAGAALRALAADLRAAADVADAGRLPDTGLAERIIGINAEMEVLTREVSAQVGIVDAGPLGAPELARILDDWTALEQRRARESERAAAREVLAAVLRIVSNPPEVVTSAHEDARAALEALASSAPENDRLAAELANGEHLLSRLLTAVRAAEGETVDPHVQIAFGTDLGTRYGLPLAMALAYRQLRLVDPGEESPDSREGKPALPAGGAGAGPAGGDTRAEAGAPGAQPEPGLLHSRTRSPARDETPATEVSVSPAAPSGSRESGIAAPAAMAVPAGSREPAAGGEEAGGPSPDAPRASRARAPTPPEDSAPATELEERTGSGDENKAEEPAGESSAPGSLTIAKLAGRFEAADPTDRAQIAAEVAARLLADGRRGLAYHAGRWAARHGAQTPVPEWLHRALVASPLLVQPSSPLGDMLRSDFALFTEDLFDGLDAARAQAVALLVAAAAVRPALLAPASLAAAPLVRAGNHFGGGLASLWRFCQIVAEFSAKGLALDPVLLKRIHTKGAWDEALAELAARTEQWAVHAPHMQIVFPPATRIWKKWQERGEVIHSLLRPVRDNDPGSLAQVRADIERLSNVHEIRRLVDRTDRELLARKNGGAVDFRAYTQMLTRVREAVELAREWVALHENAPGQASSYRTQQADQIARDLGTRSRGVVAELDALVEQHVGAALTRAGVTVMLEAVRSLEELFEHGDSRPRAEIPVDQGLNAGLLRIDGLELGADWSAPDADLVVRVLMRVLAAGELPSWTEAFERRLVAGDFLGARLVLERLETLGAEDPQSLGELDSRRRDRLVEERAVLRRVTDATEKRVDQAVMFGVLSDSEREALMDRVRAVAGAGEMSERIGRLRAELQAVTEEIGTRRQEMIAQLECELLHHGVGPGHPEHGRIAAVLEQGDVLTAREYIHHVELGLPLQAETAGEDIFARFFPATVRELSRYRVSNPVELVGEIRESRSFSAVDMGQVPEPQARAAAEAVDAWFRAKPRRGTPENEVTKTLFTFLGFNVLSVSTAESRGIGRGSRVWQDIITAPVRERSLCPVAYYGSLAAGSFASDRARYRVVWIWDEPSAEDLIGAVGETSHEVPTFVFYFGPLTEDRRRSLARLSRKERRTFLVLDEILLLHLCGEPAARMPVMFRCALPFTFLEPYVATAGLVPPEMFYGREEDRNSVVHLHGSCFIYGGRQLGKTALLRDAERRFHNPDEGRVALYIDLKAEGIGVNRPIADLLPLLADRLKAIRVLPGSLPSHASAERIVREIRAWVDEQAHRRILMLLDEGDRFLEGDKDFHLVHKLKNLMEETGRRFKVVLAGLHNVQRITRVSNNPLAHLGEPRCIGPLFENYEWRQARELVRQPLEAIGYRFESDDLVVRILSQTNYYPSLLQLYCQELLRHVNRPNVELFDSRSGPPYTITSRHVEDAYQSQELWHRIRERFHWTLDLDPRYRLIALLIAFHAHSGESAESTEGFSASQMRSLALYWWEQGFEEDQSEDTFRALLDEMVGLGILRQTERGRYRMRTGNVTLLLGTPREIDDALESMASQEPPPSYEPQSFRRKPREPNGPDYLRSPLTAQQEAELFRRENGVVVTFGTEAAGLSDLTRFIPEVAGEDFVVSISGVFDSAGFRRELNNLRERTRDGVTVLAVGPELPWSEQWVRDAAEKVAGLKLKTSFVRVLFVADPAKSWQVLCTDSDRWAKLCRHRRITTISMRPWMESALRAWLDDQGVTAKFLDEYTGAFLAETGAWPALVYEMRQSLPANEPGRWQREIQAFRATWSDPATLARRRAALALDRPEAEIVLSLLAMQPSGGSEIAEVSDLPLAEVQRVLRWLDALSLIRAAGGDAWQLDETVKRLLEAVAAHESVLVEPARS